MATGGNGPELGGYDYEFTSKVPEDWECPVCCLTLKDPVQIVGCGHRLCNICIGSLLRSSSPRCPVDRQPLSREKIFPDAACHRKILNLAVICSHSGCSWTGELRAVELEAHILDECPATKVQCEYKNLGCEEVFSRSATKSHSQTQIESHLRLALRVLEATRYQVLELVTVVKDQSQQIERQSQQIERQSQQIEKLISKDKEQSEKMERPMSTVQEQPLQREGRRSINQIFPTTFEWTINATDVGSETLFCEPFYLFKGGYKYIMKISSRSIFDKELSIKVVPGEFDDSLSWPCTEKVCVAMLGHISVVIDFEKGNEPCSRPRHDDHHEYRLILEFNTLKSLLRRVPILVRVSRE